MEKGKLSLIEVFGLSIAVVAPTGAMAFNTSGTAEAAGTAVPLAFLLGGNRGAFCWYFFCRIGT